MTDKLLRAMRYDDLVRDDISDRIKSFSRQKCATCGSDIVLVVAGSVLTGTRCACRDEADTRLTDQAAEIARLRTDVEQLQVAVVAHLNVIGEIAASVALPDVIRATGTVGDMIGYFKGLRTRAETAEARLAEAMKALEPFADEADGWDADQNDGHVFGDGDYLDFEHRLKIGHLRAARRVRDGGKVDG